MLRCYLPYLREAGLRQLAGAVHPISSMSALAWYRQARLDKRPMHNGRGF
jgi:hypothetical protein